MADTDPPLRILIAGAGIGGLATAISLARISGLRNLDIKLYEQAPELCEIGASIALSPNGMRTLERLGVHEALSDDLGFRGPSGIPQIFRHWKTNQTVSVDTHVNVPDRRHQTTRFHRGHIHAALLAHVPRSWIHLNKRVSRAEATRDGVTLLFDDGSVAEGDVLIAADGIKSKVRQSLLPEYQLSFTGKVFMRSTFDVSLVEGKVPDLPEDAIHWWGPKDSFFASRLGKGQYTTVGAYAEGRSADDIAWDQPGSVELFRDKYKDWNPVVRRLTELTPSVRLYPNYAGTALSSWLPAPRVALLGDAAHTHGGAFAAGGSLALNDALCLGLALKHVSDSGSRVQLDGIQRALELYDLARRPHATRLLNIVHSQLHAQPSVSASTEEEDAALMARLRNRPDLSWLSEHDVDAALALVLADAGERDVEGRERDVEGREGRAALDPYESRL